MLGVRHTNTLYLSIDIGENVITTIYLSIGIGENVTCMALVNKKGDPVDCPLRALGRWYMHLRSHGATKRTIISAYYYGGKRFDVTADHISAALKLAARALEYPILKGIPIKWINTHSLHIGGANALALSGYSDT